MAFRRSFTILGCGSSPGVPRITGVLGRPAIRRTIRNRRMRAALLVEQFCAGRRQDDRRDRHRPGFSAPDDRANVRHSRCRALHPCPLRTHLHGIDDLRGFVIENRRRVPIWADGSRWPVFATGFRYSDLSRAGQRLSADRRAYVFPDDLPPLNLPWRGGAISFEPLMQFHRQRPFARLPHRRFCLLQRRQRLSGGNGRELGGLDLLVIDTPAVQISPESLVPGAVARVDQPAYGRNAPCSRICMCRWITRPVRRDAGSRRAGLRHDAHGVRYRPAVGGRRIKCHIRDFIYSLI